MKKLRQPVWILTLLSGVCAGAAVLVIALVIAQARAMQPSSISVPSPVSTAPVVNGTRVASPTQSGSARLPLAQPSPTRSTSRQPAPGDSDQIPDDPTVAPDPQESADNNVSFPNDI
jgi:hypothetical protein